MRYKIADGIRPPAHTPSILSSGTPRREILLNFWAHEPVHGTLLDQPTALAVREPEHQVRLS